MPREPVNYICYIVLATIFYLIGCSRILQITSYILPRIVLLGSLCNRKFMPNVCKLIDAVLHFCFEAVFVSAQNVGVLFCFTLALMSPPPGVQTYLSRNVDFSLPEYWNQTRKCSWKGCHSTSWLSEIYEHNNWIRGLEKIPHLARCRKLHCDQKVPSTITR